MLTPIFGLLIILASIFHSTNGSELKEIGGRNRENVIHLDEDGFEILSTLPSKDLINRINRQYLNTVKPIFANKCLSCHGINEELPWYYSIPGVTQLMDYDIAEAKSHMNMSHDFPFQGHGSPNDDLSALWRTIEKDTMPPLTYRMIHWNSKLTLSEIKVIKKWITESKRILSDENN